MSLLKKIFSKEQTKKGEVTIGQPTPLPKETIAMEEFVKPRVVGRNFMTLFENVAEVFFPIDYIASRIAGARFQFKRVKDDSVVWANKSLNNIINNPNCMMTWREFVYQHHVYKLATGNSYMRAAMADVFSGAARWKYCSNYWVLPSQHVVVEPIKNIPLFGIATKEELIKRYRINFGLNACLDVPVDQVWHDRDGVVNYHSGTGNFTKATSRMCGALKSVGNLLAVYEARNVIYVKRGGLGYIISQKTDATGSVALTEKEKEKLLEQNFEKFGIAKGQVPYGISDQPIGFVRTNLSIKELEPFEETLLDAITIAGVYGIPAVLVPRKDQSTFSNQATAEKAVYSSVVIPMAKQFCRDFSHFLGLEESGYYLDCDFSEVDCLQIGLKDAEDVKSSINTRCANQFDRGLITLNDWRAQIGESHIENPLFDKLKFDMSDEELNIINRVFNTKSSEDEERGSQKPSISNEGK